MCGGGGGGGGVGGGGGINGADALIAIIIDWQTTAFTSVLLGICSV